MGWVNLREVNFLALQTAVFCIGCELISQNNSATCLACGSQALLSLSRVLGGSLRNQQTAHVIADSELDRLVRELIRTVPSPELHTNESASPVSSPSQVSGSHHVRSRSFENPERDTFSDEETQPAEISLQPAINVVKAVERARRLCDEIEFSALALPLPCAREMRSSVEREPVALHRTLVFACKPIPVFPQNVFEPAR